MNSGSPPRRETTLLQNSLFMLSGFGFRAVIQAIYFVVIARALGPGEYGAFAAACALVSLLAPFSSLGSGNLLIKHVARDRTSFSRYWGAAVSITGLSGACLAIVSLFAGRFLLPAEFPLTVVAAVSIADLVFARLVDVSTHAFVSIQRLSRTAGLHVLLSLSRLAAALFALAGAAPLTASTWSVAYLTGTAMAALFALIHVRRAIGWGPLNPTPILLELKEGLYFSVGLSAQNAYNDIDKVMLSRLSSLGDAGTYAAAYRVVNTAAAPVMSLLYSAYARFFQQGAKGAAASARYAVRLLKPSLAYSAVAAMGLWMLAPLLSPVLGSSYQDTVLALRWLSPIMILKPIHYFAADALTGSGHQGTRTLIQVLVASLNTAANLILLPRFGWLGAAWSSLASDTLLAILLWLAVGYRSACDGPAKTA